MSHAFISLDFETRSTVDLSASGVHVYAANPETDVLCMAYTLPGDDAPALWRRGEPFPVALGAAISSGAYLRAWNAAFERTIWNQLCLSRLGWPSVRSDRWVCTMALALAAGLPGKLDTAAKALGLAEEKDAEGHRIMLQLTKPRRVKKLIRYPDGTPIWYTEEDSFEKFARLYNYCRQDVRVENAAFAVLPPAMDARERRIWMLDAAMNDRGVELDPLLIGAATTMAAGEMERLDRRLSILTNGAVAGATKIADLKTWVQGEGYSVESLDKIALQAVLDSGPEPHVHEALSIRQEAGKSSVSKYAAMSACLGVDFRARGLLQYYGAGTGRWAGRLIQPQNFPKGDVKSRHLAPLIEWVRAGRRDDIAMVHGRVLDVLASLLRSCLVPAPGTVFDVFDYSAIEARVVAWLAGQHDLVDLFATGGKVYEAMAAVIFGGVAEDYAKDSFERDIGKRVVLGCGFGMGHEKFRATVIKQGGADPGEELSRRGVEAYRSLSLAVPAWWRAMDDTAVDVVRNGRTTWVDVPGTVERLAFRLHGDYLAMRLPVGRALWYARPRVIQRLTPWGVRKPAVQCFAVDGITKQWLPTDLYGGLLAENATQAVARDLLADAILRIDAVPGYVPVLTVHDEVIVESDPLSSHDELMRLATELPAWAAGCPVSADGWRGNRYRK